jgi:predicted NBD/HSP70 family sugar kinase
LGFEFGLRHVRGVLVDAAHTVVATEERTLPIDYSGDDALAVLEECRNRFERLAPGPVLGAGLAIPGPFDRVSGTLTKSSILPAWAGRRVAEEVRSRLSCAVFADNDSNLAAYGELLWGEHIGPASMIYLKLHSGIGGGIVVDGAVYRGRRGTAGEFGHLSYNVRGALCRCGNRGCLETSAGIPGILAQLSRAQGHPVTLTEAIVLIRDAEPQSVAVISSAAQEVGRALASLANIFDPDRIMLGGALLRVGARLVDGVRTEFRRSVLPVHRDIPVGPGSLGHFGSALGAAGLVFSSSFDELMRRKVTVTS